MDGSQGQTRANRLRLWITAGLTLVVLASLIYAAINLSTDGLTVSIAPLNGLLAIGLFTLLPVFETLRLAALARFKHSAGLRALGINAAAMALVQAPFGLVGAEAYRANAYGRRGERMSSILAAILVARALGLVCTLVLMALAAGFITQSLPPLMKLISASAAFLGFVLIAVAPWALNQFPTRWVPNRLRSFVSAAGLFIAIIPFVSGIIGVREGGIAGVLLLAGVPFAAGVIVGFAMRVGAVAGAVVGMALARFLLRQG